VTLSDDEQRVLQEAFDRHPEAKAEFDRRRAKEQERQALFDAMDLPELREASIGALTSAAGAISNPGPSVSVSSDDWTAENRRNLAAQLLNLAENIDDGVESRNSFNLSKWFDFLPIEDELQAVAYEAVAAYRAYLDRKLS
jgi:hypothetical protein